MNSQKKLKVLFQGWINVPHSYSMVNCFQLVYLYKNYGDKLDIYIDEMPYYQPHWYNAKKLVYTKEFNHILTSLKQWKGEDVDLVYSITYPYNMTLPRNDKTPKIVFYTSEFAALDNNYFTFDKPLQDIRDYIQTHQNIYMTSPSVWSARGMQLYGLEDRRNKIITHGADTSIFKLHHDLSIRQKIREFYKVKDTDILLMNIGAMTKNKGMMLILQAMNYIVNRLGKTHYKIILKGTGDLYQTKTFLELYFQELLNANAMTSNEMNNLITNNIIFTDKTLSYEKINELYNAVDLYISPYLAEGFNLTTLEALTAGLPVLVPQTGSTKEYIDDIYDNGGSYYITKLTSKEMIISNNGFKQNDININELIQTLIDKETYLHDMKTLRHAHYNQMNNFIQSNYSWNAVSHMLYNYFIQVTQ